jgi:hypothetical protein
MPEKRDAMTATAMCIRTISARLPLGLAAPTGCRRTRAEGSNIGEELLHALRWRGRMNAADTMLM